MKESTNAKTSYVCACARITEEDFERILDESKNPPTYAALQATYGIGGQCTSCEYEVKGLLEERAMMRKPGAPASPPPATAAPRGHWLPRFFKRRSAPAPEPPASPKPRKETGPETYRTGLFFIRKEGLESHLVVANLQFPEHQTNPNGNVTFEVKLYGEAGEHLATSRKIALPNNSSLEWTAADLFPEAPGEVVGAMYPEFANVVQTGSLRPYGVVVDTPGAQSRARCHYHDKFALFTDPGYFQNNFPFEPEQTCWMAVSNCQPQPYESDYHLEYGGKTLNGRLALGPMASRWVRLADLFPGLDPAAPGLSPALFWLDNPQHVMMYFFWHFDREKTWMCQHH